MRLVQINSITGSSNCSFNIYYNTTSTLAQVYGPTLPYVNAVNIPFNTIASGTFIVVVPDDATSLILDDACSSGCPNIVITIPPVTPTPTPTQTVTQTRTPTKTPTQTQTKTPTQTQTKTPTPTNTPTNTLTQTPTNTPTQTNTPSKSVSFPYSSTCFDLCRGHPYNTRSNQFQVPFGTFNGRNYYRLLWFNNYYYVFWDLTLATWVFKDTLGSSGIFYSYINNNIGNLLTNPWTTGSIVWVNLQPLKILKSTQSPPDGACPTNLLPAC
jgi:hypothetical protein